MPVNNLSIAIMSREGIGQSAINRYLEGKWQMHIDNNCAERWADYHVHRRLLLNQ
ncbi:unnamed protein product [Ectocarpus sp. CCAP 1310/34]|nr:unnamed protein product [Ectocarpus sp. CCAP 1310/34]